VKQAQLVLPAHKVILAPQAQLASRAPLEFRAQQGQSASAGLPGLSVFLALLEQWALLAYRAYKVPRGLLAFKVLPA
jgi:hypothetical protein